MITLPQELQELTFTLCPDDFARMGRYERHAIYDALSLSSEVLLGVGEQPRADGCAGEIIENLRDFLLKCRDTLIEKERQRPDRHVGLILQHEVAYLNDINDLIKIARALAVEQPAA